MTYEIMLLVELTKLSDLEESREKRPARDQKGEA